MSQDNVEKVIDLIIEKTLKSNSDDAIAKKIDELLDNSKGTSRVRNMLLIISDKYPQRYDSITKLIYRQVNDEKRRKIDEIIKNM